jgi:hypothetical protein
MASIKNRVEKLEEATHEVREHLRHADLRGAEEWAGLAEQYARQTVWKIAHAAHLPKREDEDDED